MLMLSSTIAVGTEKVYATGWRSWLRFCTEFKLAALNPPEHVLCAFVAWLATPAAARKRGLAVSTVRNYLSGIAHGHVMRGLPSPTADLALLRRVTKGHMRWRGIHTKQKRPITIGLLALIAGVVDRSDAVQSTVFDALCLGVHGLIRLGELLPRPSGDRSPMTRAAAYFAPGGMHASLFLPVSKSDPFGAGARVHLFASRDSTCPIAALHRLLAVPGTPSMPLLRHGDKALSRDLFITTIRSFIARVETKYGLRLRAREFAGHSMRRGGATSLSNRGVPSHFIQWLGRWKSDTYKIYIDYAPEAVLHWLGHLANSPDDILRRDLSASLRPPTSPPEWLGTD